jgi:hypothetical protein
MVRYAAHPLYAKPLALAMQPAADDVLDMHAALKRWKAYERMPIKTDVGNPSPFRGDVVTPGALALLELGRAHGFDVQLVTTADACEAQGIRRDLRVGFRATWVRRRTTGGLWLSPWRYEYEEDRRPFGVDKTARVELKGKRNPQAASPYRLRLRGSPTGIPLNVTELQARIATVRA